MLIAIKFDLNEVYQFVISNQIFLLILIRRRRESIFLSSLLIFDRHWFVFISFASISSFDKYRISYSITIAFIQTNYRWNVLICINYINERNILSDHKLLSSLLSSLGLIINSTILECAYFLLSNLFADHDISFTRNLFSNWLFSLWSFDHET